MKLVALALLAGSAAAFAPSKTVSGALDIVVHGKQSTVEVTRRR